MELTQVSCNGCGAALQVSSGARFITCKYCGANLEIKQTESAVFTEVLARVDQRTAEMAEDLEALRRSNEVAQLDREWDNRRQSLLTRGKNGSVSEPSAVGGIITIVVGLVAGIGWMGIASSIHGSGPFPLFGLLFIGISVVSGISLIAKSGRFEQERQEYERRRAELLGAHDSERLRNAENSGEPIRS